MKLAVGDAVAAEGHDYARGVVVKVDAEGWISVRWDVPPRGYCAGWVVRHCEWMLVKVTT